MKKRISWMLLAVMLLAVCTGCGKTVSTASGMADGSADTKAAEDRAAPSAEDTGAEDTNGAPDTDGAEQDGSADWLAAYAPALDDAWDVLTNFDPEKDYPYASNGLMELARYWEVEDTLNSVGYTIRDISGDGIPELLVGTVPETGENGNSFFAGYTLQDGKIIYFLEGWSRNSYQWLGGGRFYCYGSAGALSSMFGVWQVSPDGTELVCEDCYFTLEKDENFEEVSFFHNTTGDWTREASEELEISGDEFWAIPEKYVKDIQSMDMTPFSAYAYAGDAVPGKVRVDFAADVLDSLSYFEDISDPDTDTAEKVVFQAEADVQEFKVLALEFQDVDADGHAVFSTSVVYEQPVLQAGVPLAVPMSFPGDLPTNGFSYVEEDGTVRQFSVSLSGRDGSLVVASID